MKASYIGVTGFMHSSEVYEVVASLPKGARKQLMLGVLASSKTLYGVGNKWPGRYPKIDDLLSIFVPDKRLFGLVHYSTDFKVNLFSELEILTRLCLRPWSSFQGFQLNVCWPDPRIIERWRNRWISHDLVLVLQVSTRALQEVDFCPTRLTRKIVDEYMGLVDYVLLDRSGGLGKKLNPVELTSYLRVLCSNVPEVGLGIAGGLCAETFDTVEGILTEFPDLSIDAEGALRDPLTDALDVSAVKRYVQKAMG